MQRHSFTRAAWIITTPLALSIACNHESQHEANTPATDMEQKSTNDAQGRMGANDQMDHNGMANDASSEDSGSHSNGTMDTEPTSTSASTHSSGDSASSDTFINGSDHREPMTSTGGAWGAGGGWGMTGGRSGRGTGESLTQLVAAVVPPRTI